MQSAALGNRLAATMVDQTNTFTSPAVGTFTAVPSVAQKSRVTVEVKTETPFLPKAAFLLISVASLAGTYLTGKLHGVEGPALVWRWLQFWGVALPTGMLAWRLFYLRRQESGVDVGCVADLHVDLLARVRKVSRYLAPLLVAGAGASLVLPYLATWTAVALTASSLAIAVLITQAHRSRAAAVAAFVFGVGALVLWGLGDSSGLGFLAAVRTIHLLAFAAWLGGALFNLGAAVPAGRKNANLDAVVAGARQLERFRWVVRTSLPTIIVTGVWMALRYGGVTSAFWLSGIGLLVPFKLLLIGALVVIFITCPLYRACSPVRGVCNLDDLGPDAG